MARAHHHKPHHGAPERGVSKPLWAKIPHKAVIISLALAAIPFAMGKYFEFNTPGAFDSGAYMYSAHRVLDDSAAITDKGNTAQMGTLLANMLGISLFGYVDHSAKMIQMFLQAAALVTMFFVVRRIFGALAAGAALFIAAFYLSAPVIAKYGNVKEQYAIAFMMLGISMFLMRQMGGRWWWGLLAGLFLAWGPMFKQTGASAGIAAFIFLVLQPLLKNRTWRLVAADIGLILVGGALTVASVHVWLSSIGAPTGLNPYMINAHYVWVKAAVLVSPAPPVPVRLQDANKPATPASPLQDGGYLGGGRTLITIKEQAPRILRWYLVLVLPVSLALGSIVIRSVRVVRARPGGRPASDAMPYERLVLLLGTWWFIDMAFVWVSPRPWEEYYLPLCASGAVAGAYLVAIYRGKLCSTDRKGLWIGAGLAGLACMFIMAWPIAFGLRTSPFSGGKYGAPSHGYVQKFREVGESESPWETVAHYIRDHSGPEDKIYVWGWFPGIYVESKRDSASTSLPFTSESHVMDPPALAAQVKELVASFEKASPRFLVDTRKNDTPFTYPPLEFWPFIPERGFLPTEPPYVAAYDEQWRQELKKYVTQVEGQKRPRDEADSLGEVEARRFDAMKPIRDYVMANYDVVMRDQYRTDPRYGMVGPFGTHVLFVRKGPAK